MCAAWLPKLCLQKVTMRLHSSTYRAARIAILVCASCAAVGHAVMPAPPWQAQGRSATSAFEVLDYVMRVAPLAPPRTAQELRAARACNATPAELLAIIYAARMQDTPLHAFANQLGAPGTSAPAAHAAAGLVSPSTINELQRMLDQYASQWDITYRSQPGTGAPATLLLGDMLDGIMSYDKLSARVADARDPLDDIERYLPALRVPGAAMALFWQARALVRQDDSPRVQRLFEFLTHPENPDGFARGSSFFFLGRILYDTRKDLPAAFAAALKTQQHPACLVFIAHAYLDAANILNDLGLYQHALALLMVDVPNVDYDVVKAGRHLMAANIFNYWRADRTNAVRHWQIAVQYDSNKFEYVAEMLRRHPNVYTGIWYAVATNVWRQDESDELVIAGLANARATPDDVLFLDALMHDWPRQDELPLAIATNRVLNNNLFPRKERALPSGFSLRRLFNRKPSQP